MLVGRGPDLKGLDEAELAANQFIGVQLLAVDISKVVLRNNIGADYFSALRGLPKRCDALKCTRVNRGQQTWLNFRS